MRGYQIIALSTDAELEGHKVAAAGNLLRVLDVPAAVALYVRTDGSDPVRLQPGDSLQDCGDGWKGFWIDTVGTAKDAEVRLFVARDMELHGAAGDGIAYGVSADGTAVPILVDDGGRPYVRMADRFQFDLDSVTVRNEGEYLTALAVRGTDPEGLSEVVLADDNETGLRIEFEKGSRHRVDFVAELTGPGNVQLEVSPDGISWWTIHAETLENPGWWARQIQTAFPFVALVIPTPEIGITAAVWAM